MITDRRGRVLVGSDLNPGKAEQIISYQDDNITHLQLVVGIKLRNN